MARTVTQWAWCGRQKRTRDGRTGCRDRPCRHGGAKKRRPVVEPAARMKLGDRGAARLDKQLLRDAAVFALVARRVVVRQRQAEAEPADVEMRDFARNELGHDRRGMGVFAMMRVVRVVNVIGGSVASAGKIVVMLGIGAPFMGMLHPWRRQAPRQDRGRRQQTHSHSGNTLRHCVSADPVAVNTSFKNIARCSASLGHLRAQVAITAQCLLGLLPESRRMRRSHDRGGPLPNRLAALHTDQTRGRIPGSSGTRRS